LASQLTTDEPAASQLHTESQPAARDEKEEEDGRWPSICLLLHHIMIGNITVRDKTRGREEDSRWPSLGLFLHNMETDIISQWRRKKSIIKL
jgi:hypothetical protein